MERPDDMRVQAPEPTMVIALLSGVALGLAFPEPGWPGLAWVAPGGLLLCGAGRDGWGRVRAGLVGGLGFNLVALRWLLNIPFPGGAVAAWLALSAYLAAFLAGWLWWCWSLMPGAGSATGGRSTWIGTVDRLLAASWLTRTVWLVGVAAGWVTAEMVVGRLFSGFPWTALGVTQFRMIPVAQLAAWTGVPGISFVLVWVSASLALAGLRVAREPSARWGWMTEARLPLLVAVALASAGILRLEPDPEGGRELHLALVQPSIPQQLIWDHTKDEERFEQMLQLSELALRGEPDVLVWPESALPSFTETHYRAVTNLVATHQVWMVFGAEDSELRPSATEEAFDYFNAAFLLSPDGRLAGSYRKQHLVIFGEYVPLVRWLPFTKWLTPIEAGFTPGTGPVTFALRRPDVRLSVLICFEDVFAPQVRRHAAQGPDLLLNLTNNGWFGRGSAQWQHAANAVFRAIENGLPLVRCTNDGLTCWIDRFGRVRQWLGQNSGDIHAPGFLQVRVPLPPAAAPGGNTFYSQHGEVFGWGCLVWTLIASGIRWWRRSSRRSGG